MHKTRDQQVYEVSVNTYQVSDSLFVESISEDVNRINQSINQVFVNIEIGNKKTPISFKLDTGAQVNVIHLYMFHHLGCNDLECTSLFGYGGKPFKVEGK